MLAVLQRRMEASVRDVTQSETGILYKHFYSWWLRRLHGTIQNLMKSVYVRSTIDEYGGVCTGRKRFREGRLCKQNYIRVFRRRKGRNRVVWKVSMFGVL